LSGNAQHLWYDRGRPAEEPQSRAIGEMGWNDFNQMLDRWAAPYKAEWYGKNVIRIGRFEPSSKICSVCGWHNKELKLSDRTWTAGRPRCANGHTVDRDVNAAINIKRSRPADTTFGR